MQWNRYENAPAPSAPADSSEEIRRAAAEDGERPDDSGAAWPHKSAEELSDRERIERLEAIVLGVGA